MIAKVNWKETKWALVVLLAGGLFGSLLTSAYLSAGPIATTDQEVNTSNKAQWKRAKYIPNTLAVYAVSSKGEAEDSDPVVIMVGQVMADVVLPGKSEEKRILGLCYMYVNEEDLTRFPHALMVVQRDNIPCEVLDTSNPVQGLEQLRKAYAEAYGISVDDLPPIEE